MDQTRGVASLDAGDGLRAIAMLSVFVLHVFLDAHAGGLPDPTWDDWGILGQPLSHLDLGLSIFFVLSGYLISRPFVRGFVTGGERRSVATYARNRALRILPSWFVAVTAVLLYFGARGDGVREILALSAFLDLYVGTRAGFPIAQNWTLCTEVGFYVAVPIMAACFAIVGRRALSEAGRTVIALVLLGVSFALSLRWRQYAPEVMGNINNPIGIFYAFVPGIAIAVAEPITAGWLIRHRRLAPTAGVGLIVLSAAAVALYVVVQPYAYMALHHVRATQAFAAALFAGALLAGLLVLQLAGHRTPWLVGNRAMRWMGQRSYPFYLLHFGVIVALIPLAGASPTRAHIALITGLLGFPITMTLAHVVHEHVELPFLRRRRRTSVTAASTAQSRPHAVAEPLAHPAETA